MSDRTGQGPAAGNARRVGLGADAPDAAAAWRALETVSDPEIPVLDIVEMGLIRGVEVEGDSVSVDFTPTFSGCPALAVIRRDITAALEGAGFGAVRVRTVLAPPWSSDDMRATAREKLRRFGVTPPGPGPALLMPLDEPPAQCPYCGGIDTTVKNWFGATLCRELHYCNRCQEPFERFKSV